MEFFLIVQSPSGQFHQCVTQDVWTTYCFTVGTWFLDWQITRHDWTLFPCQTQPNMERSEQLGKGPQAWVDLLGCAVFVWS